MNSKKALLAVEFIISGTGTKTLYVYLELLLLKDAWKKACIRGLGRENRFRGEEKPYHSLPLSVYFWECASCCCGYGEKVEDTLFISPTVNAHTKWTARRHVLNLLRSVINDNLSPTKRDLHLVPNHQGSSCQKRVRSLEKDLVMRIAKRPRSSIVRQGQNSSSSDVIAASQAAGAQHWEPNPNKFASFVVGDEIEVLCQEDGKLCQGSDMRSFWFRCKVINISKNFLKVQYNDMVPKNGSGKLEKCIATPRLAPADKQIMRLPGRLTIRPCPDEEPPTSFEVGAAVDAWWNNGWWEGFVTTGVSLTDNDKYYVVIPGQRKYLTLHRKDLRASMEC